MTEVRRQAEYSALRATIRERGTARMVLLPLVFVAWGGTAIATSAVITVAISTLVPLLVLAAGFEAIFALYTNVERIGRYLQVFHERDERDERGERDDTLEPGWEHVAMEFGRRFPGGGPDPLFARLFMITVSVNFLPAALGGQTVEIVILAVCHFALLNRIRLAKAAAGAQRAADLERFTHLASASAKSSARAVPSQESDESKDSSRE